MTRHILVPVDDSEQSTMALEYALQEYPDDRLTVLHVTGKASGGEIPSGYGVGGSMVSENVKQQSEGRETEIEVEVLDQARQTAAGHAGDIEFDLETGNPADTIVEYLDTADVDHVVMGSHGRSGTSRILYGSVAEDVTRNSSTPVTIIR